MNKNDRIVIYRWMCDKLKLGNSYLLVFACIYGFTKSTGVYVCNFKYIEKFVGLSENELYNIVSVLEDAGLIFVKYTLIEGNEYMLCKVNDELLMKLGCE